MTPARTLASALMVSLEVSLAALVVVLPLGTALAFCLVPGALALGLAFHSARLAAVRA